MKYPAVIVVEGKMDLDLLSSFLDADIVTTNGSALSEETLNYLSELSKTRDIVVLTDPDAPGKKIRDAIASRIPNVKHAFVPKEKAIKKHKIGVAESDKETILEALNNVIANQKAPEASLTMKDLVALGLSGKEGSSDLRNRIGASLHIYANNAKTFLKRANALGITKERLKELCHE